MQHIPKAGNPVAVLQQSSDGTHVSDPERRAGDKLVGLRMVETGRNNKLC